MFSASVRGTQRYDVSLQLDDDRLIVKCTCPYFEGSIEPCKHIWAAILAAEQARRFHVPSDLSLAFDDDPTDAADLDDSDDGLLDEEVTPDLPESAVRPGVRRFSAAQRRAIADRMKQYWSERRRRAAPISRPVPPPRPAPPQAWQTFLSHVTPSQSDVAPARALHTGELIYVLDLARSAMAGGLLIELLTRDEAPGSRSIAAPTASGVSSLPG